MKIIPIKLERMDNNYPKTVEWQLGNTCNYDCEFCAPEIKNGSLPWIDIDLVIKTCQRLIDDSNGKMLRFYFTGGEPTLYKDIKKLLDYVHKRGHTTTLYSNGSRTIRWWQDLASANNLDCLTLSLHLHQGANIEHFKKIISIFNNTDTVVIVTIMATIEYFDKSVQSLEELKKYNVLLNLRGINRNDKLDNYNDYQLHILQQNASVIGDSFIMKNNKFTNKEMLELTMSDNSKIKKRASEIQVTPELSNFYGWKCSIGQHVLDIKYDTVYRGMCQVGGIISSIYENFSWQHDDVVCDKQYCTCVMDIRAPKYSIIHNTSNI